MTYLERSTVMEIGELLKVYRLKQGKSQRTFVGQILNQSYYSKVEKGSNQISVKNLIDLLHYNGISVQAFLNKFDQESSDSHYQIKEIENMIVEAYYTNDIEKMRYVKILINESQLDKLEQENQLLMVDGFLALMDPALNNKKLISTIKNKIFDIPSFTQDKLMLYCDFMRFYSLADNKIITKNILKRHQDATNTDIQELILAIVCNILIFSIENNNFEDISYFSSSIKNINTTPKLLFYKMDIAFFGNVIGMKIKSNTANLEKCQNIITSLQGAGMVEYSKELQKFLKNNL